MGKGRSRGHIIDLMTNLPKINGDEKRRRTEAVRYGFATVRLEGLEPGPEAEAIANRFIEGQLSHEEYHAEMRKLALAIARNGH